MDTIRSAAQQFGGLGWRTYDEQFRLKQAVFPSIHGQLLIVNYGLVLGFC